VVRIKESAKFRRHFMYHITLRVTVLFYTLYPKNDRPGVTIQGSELLCMHKDLIKIHTSILNKINLLCGFPHFIETSTGKVFKISHFVAKAE
jgi:hypothetical protein